MASQLHVDSWQVGSLCVVTVTGELDVLTAPRLEKVVDHVLESGSTSVLVELSGVTFLASAGVGVLVDLRNRLSATDGRCGLVPSDPVKRVLSITGLLAAFEIFPSRIDALRRFAV